jgi:hypothetical protein
MKKNVILLTGIVFLIALLVAGGCSSSPKTDTNGDPGVIPPAEIKDPEGIDIFLRAVLIDDVRHLEMYESRKEDCPAIDGLITEVNPYDTVYWKKATASKIKEVTLIRLMTADYKLFGNSVEKLKDEEGNDLWAFIVPDFDDADTIKYEIHFTVDGNDKDTTIIDPYLKLPKQL